MRSNYECLTRMKQTKNARLWVYKYCCVSRRVVLPGSRGRWRREKKEGEWETCLVPRSSSLRSRFPSLFIALFFSTFVHLHEKLLSPPPRPEDESWNGSGRRSADGSAAHESALIALSVGSLLSSCLSVCSSAVWFLFFVFFCFFSLRYLLLQVSQYDIPNSQEAMLASAPAQKKRKFSEPKERFWPHTVTLRRFQSGLLSHLVMSFFVSFSLSF